MGASDWRPRVRISALDHHSDGPPHAKPFTQTIDKTAAIIWEMCVHGKYTPQPPSPEAQIVDNR
jgi:hypothetical protein